MEQEMNEQKTSPIETTHPDIQWMAEKARLMHQELGKYIVGQEEMIQQLLVGLLANGHVLLEGVPGIAKTLVAKCLAKTLNIQFSRIQFTPDLMPSDVLGTSVFDMKESSFNFKKGPIFSNIVLIDEINRAPAKTQAALFEVMEERQITFDGTRYTLQFPFLVIATQNPIEQEGTYNLPEAQLDRFLFKVHVDYPNLEEEMAILTRYEKQFAAPDLSTINAVFTVSELERAQKIVESIVMEERLLGYIAQLTHKTRNHGKLYMGGSPRASLSMLKAAKAFAALEGRSFVIPDDIQRAAIPVLNHRIILTPEAEMEGARKSVIIEELIAAVEVPR